MADNDVDTGPITTLAAGGYIVIAKPTGVGSAMRFERVPGVDVEADLALARASLQPGDVGEAGALSLAELDARIAASTGDLEALLTAILGPQ